MITELSVKNFKSWENNGTVHFAPLTGLFGANNSGKSSILQVLLMLKQTVERPVTEYVNNSQNPTDKESCPVPNDPLYFGQEESLVNLGSFDDVIYQHDPKLSLDIDISWKINEQDLFFSTTIEQREVQLQVENFCYNRKWLIKRKPGLSYKDYVFTSPPPTIPQIRMSGTRFRCYGVRDFRNEYLNSETVNNPSEQEITIQKKFDSFEANFTSLFSRICYIAPLRNPLPHHYTWEEHPQSGVGKHGEKTISAMLTSRVNRRSIDEKIMEWLKRFGLIYSYNLHSVDSVKSHYELFVKAHKYGPEVRPMDVGFGVSQVLPLLVQCYYVPDGGIIILEQPEAHLHPKVQADLADVFIDVVNSRNVQIIFESHSEHILHRLMRRIAEAENISEKDIALYFCKMNDGTSAIEKLKVDEYGNISNWPQGFFGDVMSDLGEKTKAEMVRRKGISG